MVTLGQQYNVGELQEYSEPCMAIVVSVQYNGGILPDIILLTLCYCHRRTRNAMKSFCACSLYSHLNVLTSPPPPCLGDAQNRRFGLRSKNIISSAVTLVPKPSEHREMSINDRMRSIPICPTYDRQRRGPHICASFDFSQ